jgi:GT2 family glycosyltransferase
MTPAHDDNPAEAKGSDQARVLVSIIIPAYRAAAYIAGTLNSVLAQTFTNYEILVVNDGSPDTPAFEQALSSYLSKIRYIRQENRGPSSARNAAIREAWGKYIAFLDSDDLWLPHHLARHMEALEKDPSLGLIYANGVHIEGTVPVPVGVAFDRTAQSLPVTFEKLLREQSTVNMSATVASRAALLRAGLFDEQLKRCEDFDLWLRMAHQGVKMTFTRDVQICHRLSNGLAASHELMKRARIQVCQKVLSNLPLTEEQSRIARRKIADIQAELELELAKQALLAGEFEAALRAARKAGSAAPHWKLHAAQVGLRFFPGLFQKLYRSHLQRVERRKRDQRARSLEAIGVFGKITHLEALSKGSLKVDTAQGINAEIRTHPDRRENAITEPSAQ